MDSLTPNTPPSDVVTAPALTPPSKELPSEPCQAEPCPTSSSGPSELQISLVYNELRRLASIRLRTMSPGKSLHATALVHEAYLRLAKMALGPDASLWNDRNRFFAAAAQAMRQVVIDHHRLKRTLKRGGDRVRIELDIDQLGDPSNSDTLMALDEALSQLELKHPEKAQLVKLRFFVGMTLAECALALGVSLATAGRHWRYARAWLARHMNESA